MIPRTKVNYNLWDLWQALWVSERQSDYLAELTHQLQTFLNEPWLILMPSGRAGLYFLLKALPQHRVVMPAYTCKAVAEAALLAGKEIDYVDTENNSFNLSTRNLIPLLDSDTVVIATHQFGIPCNICEIIEVCRAHGAIVIEDVAAALGTRVGDQLVGTFGDAAFYSFDSTKLINVPLKSGFLTVKDATLYARIQSLSNSECMPMPQSHKLKILGKAGILVLLENHILYRIFHTLYFQWRNKFTDDSASLNLHKTEFYRYQMANWQAWLALPQILNLSAIIACRQQLYSQYRQALENCLSFALPPHDASRNWACIRFPIRVKQNKIAYYKLANHYGLDFAFSFTFIPCYDEKFPNAQELADTVLDLPFYKKLTSQEFRKTIKVLQSLDVLAVNESSNHDDTITYS